MALPLSFDAPYLVEYSGLGNYAPAVDEVREVRSNHSPQSAVTARGSARRLGPALDVVDIGGLGSATVATRPACVPHNQAGA
ncbi:MAG TPA: hypothetical protein VGL48_13840 [Acidimicrobiales bacterium]